MGSNIARLVLVVALGLPSAVVAADDAELDELLGMSLDDLLEMDVTGMTRYRQDATEVATSVTVITAEQIKARGYRDLKDIFYDVPGIDVSGNVQGEVRTLVIMRGILGNQKLLILQDGQRLNPITGERFVFGNNVPVHHAKRVEILFGPAAAVYGPDAYAGVVNIVTVDGADIDGVEVNVSAGLLDADGRSFATDEHLLAGTTFGDDGDVMVSLRWYHTPRGPDLSDDYDELRGIQYYANDRATFEHSEPVTDWDAYLKLRTGDFVIGARYSDASEPNGPSTIPDQYLYVDEYVWRQILAHVYATHTYVAGTIEASTTLRYQLYQVHPDSNFYLAQNFFEDADVLGWNGQPIKQPTDGLPEYKFAETNAIRLEHQTVWRPTEWFVLSGGALAERVLSFPKTKNLRADRDGRFDPDHLVVDMSEFADVDGLVLGTTTDQAWGVRPYHNLGANLQAEVRHQDKAKVGVGTRVDYNTDYSFTVNPRIGGVLHPSDNWTLRGMLGTAYIQPSNYYVWENWANPFAMHIPNLDLEPEKLLSTNVGISYRITADLNIALDVFYNRMTDLIRPVPAQGVSVVDPYLHPSIDAPFVEINANQGAQYAYGGELKVDYVTTRMHAYGSYAYLDGRDEESDFRLNKISHHKVLLGMDYRPLPYLVVSPRLRWFSPITMAESNSLYQYRLTRRDDPRTTFGSTWGTFLVNANVRVEPTEGLAFYATLNNVLNQAHYGAAPYGESIWILPRAPQLRFNFMAGVSYRYSL